MKEKRIYYYDLIKSIAIYLVCFYHFGTPNIDILSVDSISRHFNYFLTGISSMGVPLFLMVNGALLLNKEYVLERHIYKIAIICMLFFIWGAITLGILAPLYGDHYSVASLAKAIYYTRDDRTTHLWFLGAMMFVYIMFPLVKSLYDKNEKKYLAYLLVMIFIFTFGNVLLNELLNIAGYFLNIASISTKKIPHFPWFAPFNFQYAYALVYFIAGGVITKNMNAIYLKSFIYGMFFLFFSFLLFLFGLMKTSVNGVVYDTVWNGYNTIMTLGMSLSVFMLCTKTSIKNDRFIKVIIVISSNTLGIYLIQVPVGFWLTKYYESLSISEFLIFDLLYAFLILCLSLVITLGMKRIPIIKRLVTI